MAYVNGGQAGTAFKRGPKNMLFKEHPFHIQLSLVLSRSYCEESTTHSGKNNLPFVFLGGSMKSASLVIQSMNLPEDRGSTLL